MPAQHLTIGRLAGAYRNGCLGLPFGKDASGVHCCNTKESAREDTYSDKSVAEGQIAQCARVDNVEVIGYDAVHLSEYPRTDR